MHLTTEQIKTILKKDLHDDKLRAKLEKELKKREADKTAKYEAYKKKLRLNRR